MNNREESNLRQDIYAAQVLFDSPMTIWQIPLNVYAGTNISFAELIQKVKPCGEIGRFAKLELAYRNKNESL